MQGNVNIPDSTITTNLSFRQLVLMNMQQLTNFPYIEKDFDALTDYELLSLVVKYLNDVIANQNEQNDSITRMYESFLELQTYVNNTKDTLEDAFNALDDYVRNYFDNLDVQDEINNKLDQMLEDGVLEQIIEQFLQSTAIWCFNTVADMKAATNLIDGSDARTLGYYSINDGGGSLYHITETESLTEYQEELNSGLYATIVKKSIMSANQFGAYGDGVHDDSLKIQTALLYCDYLIFPSETYLANSIILTNNKTIDGLNHNFIMDTNTKLFSNTFSSENEEHNITIKNLNIDCTDVVGENEQNNVIYLCGVNNSKVENVNIKNSKSDGIYIGSYNLNKTNKNLKIENCSIVNSGRNNISIICGNVIIDNCYCENGTVSSIDIEPNNIGEDSDVIISNSIIKNGLINGYLKETLRNNLNANVTITNCKISKGLLLQYMNNVTLENNYIENLVDNNIVVLYTNKFNKIHNNRIKGLNTASGIKHSSSNYGIITNNYIESCKYGIELLDSSFTTISNNKLIDNITMGIYNRGTTQRNSYCNNAIKNGVNAFYSDSGSYEQFIGNNSLCDDSTTTRAFVFGANTSKSLIVDNIATGFSEYGIRDTGTDNVKDNNITT